MKGIWMSGSLRVNAKSSIESSYVPRTYFLLYYLKRAECIICNFYYYSLCALLYAQINSSSIPLHFYNNLNSHNLSPKKNRGCPIWTNLRNDLVLPLNMNKLNMILLFQNSYFSSYFIGLAYHEGVNHC